MTFPDFWLVIGGPLYFLAFGAAVYFGNRWPLDSRRKKKP